jgi:hypothetical protein
VKKLSILPQYGPNTTKSDRSANQSGLGDGHGGSWFVLEFVFLAGICHNGLYGGKNNSLAAMEEGIDDRKEAPRKISGRYGFFSLIPK